MLLPMAALAAALLYQATNPALYYTIALGVYFWAYSEGEVRHFSIALTLRTKIDAFFCRLWPRLLGLYPNESDLGSYR